ncbi:hypothetical protein A3F65_03625 [Candidatus Saccharibacteria bacterium RIFCSPHIGHO2_12_FULL_47_16b]|nr:MAG: hypothetical protein A3F65_03625 [Candidatus Saccharibacteria bacterium RIFCSPHIGHO2_12_FULL_47_16b]
MALTPEPKAEDLANLSTPDGGIARLSGLPGMSEQSEAAEASGAESSSHLVHESGHWHFIEDTRVPIDQTVVVNFVPDLETGLNLAKEFGSANIRIKPHH